MLCYFIVLGSLYPLLYLLLTAPSILPTHDILPRVRLSLPSNKYTVLPRYLEHIVLVY